MLSTMNLFAKLSAGLVSMLVLAGACAAVDAQNHSQVPQSEAAYGRPAGWANSRSDLPQDKDFTLGVLPNGMRYLILPNRNPPGQVALRMVIAAGSMQESPGQEGIAHFLEHLAFRGTKLFPDGEIQRSLENLGLQMGSDANATTHADHTSFMLDMARNDTLSLDTGLLILREIASELTLDPAMIDAERGVVLAEERMRASPETQAGIDSLRMQLGDHPYAREVVGKRTVIQGVTQPEIRAFYDAFYRPDRATLVVVGDLKPADVVQIIKVRFGDWVARGPAGADPAPVMKKPDGPGIAAFAIDGASESVVEMYWFEPWRQPPPTKAERRRALVERLGQRAVAQRMRGLTEAAGRPARSISAPGPSRIAGVWNGQFARASGVSDIAKTINLMVTAQRQAVAFGITQEELDREKLLRLEDARQQVVAGRNGSSPGEAESIVDQLLLDPVFVSPEDSLAILEEQLNTVTLEEVNAALRQRLKGEPTVIYRGPKGAGAGETAMRAAYDTAMAAPVTVYAMDPVKPWPYRDFGPAGKVVERSEVADLGVTFVTFANGVRLTVKPLPSMEDQAFVQVRLGLGRLGMPRDRLDASDMGLSVWSTGGLGKLTPLEQGRTLAGKRVGVALDTQEDSYAISSFRTPADSFGLQMELMAAQVSDAAFRTDEWDAMIAASDRADASSPFTAARVLDYNIDPLLHSGDLRWTYNTPEMRHSWKPQDAVAWIRPIVATSPLEVIVVGDIDVEKTVGEAARTFGALPPRPEKPEPKGLRDVKFPAHTDAPVVLKHKGRADQAYAVIAWPTGQGLFGDSRGSLTGSVLAEMLRDEATRQLRTGSGATYSPSVIEDFPMELSGYGYVGMQIELPPEKLDAVLAQIEAIAVKLATDPVAVSEVTRITGPRIEQVKRERASSAGYWAAYLAGASADPARLEYLRNELSIYQSMAPADIQAAAKRWLKPETVWKLKVAPG
jgi:zinc protease